ncbi:MAG: glycosyltransferase [Rhodospirillales bacterium]|nr:glycosyltransferase [Rhodospirillales bacterium]
MLVFEPEGNGHQQEWLEHLIAHAADRPGLEQLWIVAPAGLCQALRPHRAGDRVRLLLMTAGEERRCQHANIAIGGLWRWWTMRRYLRRTGAEAGHFLQLDHLSLPLALGLRLGGRPVGGILFRPSVHYGDLGPYRPSWRERVRDARKGVLYRLMLRNPALHSVLSLDPHFPRYVEAHYSHAHKVRRLRDPAHPLHPSAAEDQAITADVPPTRMLFSLFGYLTERKGVLVLLEALRLLPPLRRARLAVIVAGRTDPALRDAMTHLRARVARDCPELWLHYADRRLSDGELTDLVTGSDVVLAPYQRFVGSSGVLLWAAQAGRPLLTQEIGLMGRLVRDHGLGLTADTSDPVALAAAMDTMIARGPASFFDPVAARIFADQCTPDSFADTVIGSMTGEAVREPVAV